MNNDKSIAAFSYFHIEHEIDYRGKFDIKTEYQITLYEDKVVTASHQFKLENVLDMSYKLFSNNDSLLYLHTNQGVFTYKLNDEPVDFVKCFKQIKEKR